MALRIWLASDPENSCIKILQWPVIIIGAFILIVGLAGFVGGFWRNGPLLIFYLVGMFIMIILLACLVVFVFMVTSKGSGHPALAGVTWNIGLIVFRASSTEGPWPSGCCKPPTACGYTFVNPTFWISPIDTAADMDCLAWNNDQNQLCYSCDACKAGLLASLSKQWKKANIILIVTLIALICVYLIGCCAFRNAKTEDIFRKYKQGIT
ncbi:Protein TORNADO 2 [Bienertia sinuspersici]